MRCGQLAGGNAAGRLGDGAHRTNAVAGDQDADDDGKQRGGEQCQPEIALQLVEKIGVMADVAADDDARRFAPRSLQAAGDDAVIAPGERQARGGFADGAGRGSQLAGERGIRPVENGPFFAVDRHQHAMFANQRIAEAGGKGGGCRLVAADMADERQLAEQFVGVQFGHVLIGRAAQVGAQRGENQRRQQREGERQAQGDGMPPAAHGQRISMT